MYIDILNFALKIHNRRFSYVNFGGKVYDIGAFEKAKTIDYVKKAFEHAKNE